MKFWEIQGVEETKGPKRGALNPTPVQAPLGRYRTVQLLATASHHPLHLGGRAIFNHFSLTTHHLTFGLALASSGRVSVTVLFFLNLPRLLSTLAVAPYLAQGS